MTKLGEWHKVYWKFIDHIMVLLSNTRIKNSIYFNFWMISTINSNLVLFIYIQSTYNIKWYILWSKSKKTLSLKSILYAVFDMFLAPYILYEYMQDYIIYSNIWVCERPHEWLKSVALKSHTIRTDSVLMSCTITKWP